MQRLGILVATGLLAAVVAGGAARAEEGTEIRTYFGAAYETGWMQFKNAQAYDLYGTRLSGYAPYFGVTFGQNFAFEFAYRAGYGTGGADDPVVTTDTSSSGTFKTTAVSSYRSSSVGIGMDLVVRYPLGKTGITPFFLTGLSIAKNKEMMLTSTTVEAVAPTTGDTTHTSVYQHLLGKTETSPEIGLGLAYSYGGAELRVLGRLQSLNMNNAGQYLLTVSAGLQIKV